MEEKSNVTLKKIQEAAMAEFLDKAFKGFSAADRKDAG